MIHFSPDLSAPWMIPAAQALLHFLWQGTVLAAGLAVALRRLRNASASDRHALACATLTLMAVAPVATFFALKTDGVMVTPIAPMETPVPATQTVSGPIATAAEGGSGMIPPWILPWITALWILGVVVSALRLLGGAWRLHRWATRETSPAPLAWQERCDSLGRQLDLRRPVPLRESARVHGPLLVGWFRPMLVLPIGMLQSLPGLQIEALLLHELAHVRGRDPLIHLLQRAVEALLFYHPAVWWVSEQIRREREHRCDDRVLEAQGEGHSLAEALVTLAERAHAAEPLALAATDGSVASRVRRLLQGQPAGSTATTASRKSWIRRTLALVVVGLGMALVSLVLGSRLYVATARLRLESQDGYTVMTSMQAIQSPAILATVTEIYELPKRWSLDPAACVDRLTDRIQVSQYRNSPILEIRMASEDPKLAADLANTLAEQAVDRNMRNLEDYRRARGEVTTRLVTELAQAKNKLVRSTTNDFDSVLATSQIKVYEALLENALRTQAETSLSPQARGQVIDRAVPPIRRSRWNGN
jgi:beta-lactamase regulating signal transducer with metallopeptidase domain